MTVISRGEVEHADAVTLVHTARTTGLLYLGLGVTGILGFLLVRPALFAPDDAAATMVNLVEHAQMARVGIALEMGIVLTQTLTALWFFRLFRSVDAFAAGAIAVFGLVNSVVILASAALLATGLEVAVDPVGDAGDAQLMYLLSENLWGVGALFFGLWLVPMGWCVLRSRWMPRALGWILLIGGGGYVLSAFVGYLVPDASLVAGLLAVPATVGEFWIIGYLLVRGVNRSEVK
jgi:hypothetical protein